MNPIPKTLSFTLSRIKYPLNLKQLQQIHAQILTDAHIITSSPLLVDFITTCYQSKAPRYTFTFLYNLPHPDPFLWNTIIKSSLQSQNFLDFVLFYNGFRYLNFLLDTKTFTFILRSCASSNLVRLGESFHGVMAKMGFGFDVVLQTGLLDFYAKVGDFGSAKKVFDQMPSRDVIANNAMIAAWSKYGFVDNARKLFDSMVEKNCVTWNSMITCYSKVGDLDSARLVFDRSPVKDVVSWNAMIDGYCKAGRLMDAEELFMKIGVRKNAITWNTMIAGYVHCREFAKAINIFQEMQAEEIRATEVTMVSLLTACAHLGALDLGEWIHSYIRRKRLRVDVFLGNALIDMYCKCGSLDAALDVFHGIGERNIFCWNSIIVGLGMHGYGNEAIEVFTSMEKERVKPDGVTLVGLLCACSHSGLVSAGRTYFSKMCCVYGVEPAIEHYGCMVDLLGRAGCLEEALQLVESMPMKQNAVVWGSLLRACHVHKNTTVGEKVTRHLLELDPCDGGNYVFLSNLYASMNRWSDVDMCRKLMIDRGVHKTPGCSAIELDNTVHEFVAGDTSHPQFLKINAFLDDIAKKLQAYSYQPDTTSVLHDIEDEEKETTVRYHSERIAVAFGLMSTPPGKVIRVVKNLRTCNDCHSAIKLIALVYKREIIMRDRNRFHHFRNGLCSCNDFW